MPSIIWRCGEVGLTRNSAKIVFVRSNRDRRLHIDLYLTI